ncbi:type II secretion system protein [bacterium]|nr:type II secretion system protein [bacterium]NCQ55158.1 type II secretion system protein [Candidatus Parcubacteria bacterium]NCS67329.1 type II secretion system protein [Candidatus Peregrinibacteria bacterium]NCS96584.1 type II secretion system protein [bacterium]
MKKKGFTLIELLVVIVIISILAGISVATLVGYQEKARIAAQLANLRTSINELLVLRIDYENGSLSASDLMQKDLRVVELAINVGRLQTKQNLIDITGNTCSDCICRNFDFVSPIANPAQACIDRWDLILTAIKASSEIDLSFMNKDPWGSPYLVDENEGEQPGNYCRRDTLFSAGPDRRHEAIGEDATGDGYSIRLDFYNRSLCGD